MMRSLSGCSKPEGGVVEIIIEEEKSDLVKELSKKIKNYKRRFPDLTSSQIAKRFKIPVSTFHRIENQDISNPTFEHVVKILKGVEAEKELCQFIASNYPNVYQDFENNFEDVNQIENHMSDDVLEMMAHESYGKLVRLAGTIQGVSREFVKDKFGDFGLEQLDELYLRGVLYQEDGLFKYKGRNSMDFVRIKKVVIQAIRDSFHPGDLFDEQNKPINFMSYVHHPTNAEKALPLITEELENAKKKIQEIMVENPGTEHVWLSLCTDTIFPNRYSSKLKGL